MLFLADMAERLTFVALDAEEYWTTIAVVPQNRCSRRALTYDALLARCALKAKAETIFTWNLAPFSTARQLGIKRLVRTP